MADMHDGSPGDPATPPNGTNDAATVARQDTRIERRSPKRPKFVAGWRKELQRKLAQAQAASPTTAAATGRVDIWIANPDALLKAEACLKVLSDEDWISLNRIQDPSNRRSAIAARVLLRIGLSRASGNQVAPSDWRFATAKYDKPVVAEGLPPINFSVTHVDKLAAVAVSPSLDIGIDVECVDQNVSENVVAEFCHLDEHHSVGGLPRPQEIREFIRLWTLKEAYTKMTGQGHELDFKMIKFTLDPIDLRASGNHKRNGSTQFETFYVSQDHALFHASLAIRDTTMATGSTEVQIISLAASGEDAVQAAPVD